MEFTSLAARLILAVVFLLAGVAKLLDPVGTRKALRGFGVPAALTKPLVILLPLVELAAAALLIPPSMAWYGAWGAVGLLAVFSIAIAISMLRGRKPDCHCFGQLHSEPVGWPTLLRNGALALCAIWLIERGQGRSGPNLVDWYAGLSTFQGKVVVLAGCVVAALFVRVLYGAGAANRTSESHALIELEDDGWGEEDAAVEQRPVEPPRPRPTPVPVVEPAPVDRPAPVRNAQGIGLPIGTPAPDFELPAVAGEKYSLRQLLEQARARDLFLLFSSPFCESCIVVTSRLARSIQRVKGLPDIVLISVGSAQSNASKAEEFGASRVLLQQSFEIAELFDSSSTPTGVLIGADGLIQSGLAVGGVAIMEFLSGYVKQRNPEAAESSTGGPDSHEAAPKSA